MVQYYLKTGDYPTKKMHDNIFSAF